MTASTARRCNVRSLRSGELEPASTTTWDSFTSACGRSTAHRGTGAIRREDRPAASAASEDTDRSPASAASRLDPDEWTPRELRRSFVSVLSDAGVPLEEISRLVGHSGTTVTELVYRHQLISRSVRR